MRLSQTAFSLDKVDVFDVSPISFFTGFFLFFDASWDPQNSYFKPFSVFKMAPNGTKDALKNKYEKLSPFSFKNDWKMGSFWGVPGAPWGSQDGPQSVVSALSSPFWPQEGSKGPPEAQKGPQKGPKRAPEGAQEDPKRARRGLQNVI